MKVALFDFDGTIIRGNSFHEIIKLQLRSGFRRSIALGGRLVARRLRLCTSKDIKNEVLSEYAGIRREELLDVGRGIYTTLVRSQVEAAAVAEMERLRASGFVIVVISGAFDFVLEPFCVEYGICHWAGAAVGFNGDLCAGRLSHGEMRGHEKVQFIERAPWNVDVEWGHSIAFSDEYSDRPMLDLCGRRVVVGEGKKQGVHLRISGAEAGAW